MAGVTRHLTFARSGGERFQIGPDALAMMRRYIQDDDGKPEAGGVLLGRHLLGTGDIIVDRVTTPLPGDRRGRFRFHRARRRHQEMIDRAWGESDGTCTYLGEWHTHPQDRPEPSCIDRLNWWRKLQVDRFTEPIFFVIVGTIETRVWEGRRDGRVVRLRVR
jgi:integrative and conjugative element protein (TIGR02256 family)